MRINKRHLKQARGFTYLGLMLIVAIAGIALSGVGIVWKTEMQRENEKQLRFVGEQYVAAIASYYECKVCGTQQLPKNLKDLLKDNRAPSMVRHLRKVYRDPMTNSNDWGLIKNGDRIKGVYSKSKLEPLAKPYDNDLFKKKKDANKTATDVNLNQTNANSANSKQAQDNINNGMIDSNKTGTNQTGLTKTENSKTDKPIIKQRKSSYQDWKFVFDGAGSEIPANGQSTSNQSGENQSTLSQTSAGENSTQNEPSPLERCQTAYNETLVACRAQINADKENRVAGIACLKEARVQYDQCSASIR